MSNININVKFQNDAIAKLKKRINFAINDGDINEFNFKSCVASGKTVMCGRLMQDLFHDSQYSDYSFIWISTSQGNLCYQSKETIENIVDFDCLDFEEALSNGSLLPETCTFIPWEQINKDNNKYRGSAEYNTFEQLLSNSYNPIILFVDEAHDTYGTENSEEIVSIINPKLCIKISATPRQFDAQFDVEVKIESVIEEGFIKKVVELQKDLIKTDDDSLENILLSAIKKREELEEGYKLHNINYIPLCLIQIANDSDENKSDKDDEATKKNKDTIIDILKEHGILLHEIGVWLSEDKTNNLKNIKNNDVKFLIIKQALAKGWDCPRSHVLVRLRETKSVILDIQTMGRILRTIDKFVGHYNDDLIDSAYIYTNDPGFKLSENNNIPTRNNAHKTKVKSKFEQESSAISLPASHFVKKQPSLKGNNLFNALCLKINDSFIANNNTIIEEKISRLQLDANSVDVDKTIWNKDSEIPNLETKMVLLKQSEIEQKYEAIIRKIYSPLAQTLLDYLDEIADKLNISQIEFYKYVVSNEDAYTKSIKAALETIREKTVDDYCYNVPTEFICEKAAKDEGNYLYEEISQVTLNKLNSDSPESLMINYLMKNTNVLFWYKNIERNPTAFCISYDNTGGTDKNDNFYPDFIVLDKNKKLWILGTKGGEDNDIDKKTPEKYVGIQNYLKVHKNEIITNNNIVDLCFSIVRPLGKTLKVFVGEDYKKSLSDSRWNDLSI